MIDPSVLGGELAAAWLAIPELNAEMTPIGKSVGNIISYEDTFPFKNNVSQALSDLGAPGILIVYQGQDPFGDYDRYGHRFQALVRMGPVASGATPPLGYSQLIPLMIDGVPQINGNTLPMRCYSIDDSVDPMNPPTWQRLTDTDQLDYFAVDLLYVERGV